MICRLTGCDDQPADEDEQIDSDNFTNDGFDPTVLIKSNEEDIDPEELKASGEEFIKRLEKLLEKSPYQSQKASYREFIDRIRRLTGYYDQSADDDE